MKSRSDMAALADEFEASGAKLSLGENYLEAIYGCDIVFRAPGVYFNMPELKKAKRMPGAAE